MICTPHCTGLLAEQETIFEAVWQRLTLAQRATLRAVVLSESDVSCCLRTCEHVIASEVRRLCRPRFRRSRAKISSPAKAIAMSSSTP